MATRRYELKRRAERQEQTRLRIVEATVELHSTLGPARTTISAIAERAGVQRHTVYAHFPDERGLLLACSGLHLERFPLPDPATWPDGEPEERLRRGLAELYDYYRAHEQLLANVHRDLHAMPLTAEIVATRIAPRLERIAEALGHGLPRRKRVRAALGFALSFPAWQALVAQPGVTAADEVAIGVGVVLCQVRGPG